MRIFIDTNIYLALFLGTRLRTLLPVLEEASAHLFVSDQIVREVERNKAKVVGAFLTEQAAAYRAVLPLGFLGLDLAEPAELENRANAYLASVAASRDPVSRALARLFRQAAFPDPAQLERARTRRERGDAPGKREDTLGDQLTWEMWLDVVGAHDRVWIITNDHDYFTRFGGSRYLNPLLQRDLDRVHGAEVRAHVFDKLAEGLADFARSFGLASLPSGEEMAQIAKEERALRSRG
jgi:hypothetical protein